MKRKQAAPVLLDGNVLVALAYPPQSAAWLDWTLHSGESAMTDAKDATLKQKAHELIDQLPEDATWRDVAYRAAVRAEAEEGRAEWEAGRIIDGDEVMRWIDSWGSGHELEAPHVRR